MRQLGLLQCTLVWLVLVTPPTWAARPMITDDARIVDPKSCQLETWVKQTRQGDEFWLLPACNVGENFELSLGGAQGKTDAERHTTDVVLQAKTLFKPLQSNDWGWGLTFGNVHHPAIQPKANLLGDTYVYVPVSRSFDDDRLLIHANIGYLHDKTARQNNLMWGVGTEVELNSRLQLIGEVFGQNQNRPYYQIGLRYWLIPARVQLDTTYGSRWDQHGDSSWISLGLRFLSPAWLP